MARATDVVTKYPTMHRTAPTKRKYLAPNFNSVEGETYFSISITCLPSLWPSKLTHGSGTDVVPGASQVNLKPKQLVVMEKQGPEHSRMVSKVKVGSKVEWMVTERNVKLESSSEISTSNKCCIRKGMLDCKTFFKRLSKLLTP